MKYPLSGLAVYLALPIVSLALSFVHQKRKVMGRPRKLGNTFKLDTWLRVALPTKRVEDRWKIFRDWMRFLLQKKFDREPTDTELENAVSEWQKMEFGNTNYSFDLMYMLRDFLPIYHKQMMKQRSHAAAMASWADKSRRKIKRRKK